MRVATGTSPAVGDDWLQWLSSWKSSQPEDASRADISLFSYMTPRGATAGAHRSSEYSGWVAEFQGTSESAPFFIAQVASQIGVHWDSYQDGSEVETTAARQQPQGGLGFPRQRDKLLPPKEKTKQHPPWLKVGHFVRTSRKCKIEHN